MAKIDDDLREQFKSAGLGHLLMSEDVVEKMRDDCAAAKENADNWKHRSTGMKCATCMWYAPKAGSTVDFGRCRRHAPTMNGYPAVFGTDWCGDHKLDENKIGR